MASLTMLPDHVLVAVFQLLDMPTLLAARGVCRRWRDLAVHRAVWRHRFLGVFEVEESVPRDHPHIDWIRTNQRCMAAAVRLAPCLKHLSLNRDSLLRVPLRHVKCAVSDLQVWSVDQDDLHGSMRALRGLLSAGAGALRVLRFRADRPSLRLLLRVLRDASLTDLELGVSSVTAVESSAGVLALRGRSVPTLRRLSFSCDYADTAAHIAPDDGEDCTAGLATLEFLLQTHAATLETVCLSGVPSDFPVALLTACPNLRQLQCPTLEGLPALLECASLEELHLVLVGQRPAVIQAARSFFAVATGLRALTLSHDDADQDVAAGLNLELVGRLAATRRSRLVSLSVLDSVSRATVDFPRLAALLPAFAQLTRLVLASVGSACHRWPELLTLLQSISPGATPNLKRLDLGDLAICPGLRLYEEWPADPDPEDTTGRYVQDIRALLARNPALHVFGLAVCRECRRNECYRRLQCDGCWVAGRQQPVRRTLQFWRSIGLFSHSSAEPCDLHTGDHGLWAQLAVGTGGQS